MFTGLIEATGRIAVLETVQRARRLRVETALAAELVDGDSIATNGVCLTVTQADTSGFSADLSPETLRVTSFGTMAAGRVVNLERPLRADSRLGGHFVLGHVDAVGEVLEVRADGDAHWLEIAFPADLAPLLILKGSVAVDGISLTVASLGSRRFGVQLVPFTWQHTALPVVRPGDPVNLEADVLGKYVVRLLETHGAAESR